MAGAAAVHVAEGQIYVEVDVKQGKTSEILIRHWKPDTFIILGYALVFLYQGTCSYVDGFCL
jgi:hypothetical protein